MATASLTFSAPPKAGPRFGRRERTEIRAYAAANQATFASDPTTPT